MKKVRVRRLRYDDTPAQRYGRIMRVLLNRYGFPLMGDSAMGKAWYKQAIDILDCLEYNKAR